MKKQNIGKQKSLLTRQLHRLTTARRFAILMPVNVMIYSTKTSKNN